ncbi:MAG: hypothetical protein OEM41_06180 [Ignavibacteria bacterium]|nr:hypothetical protein [Ignavibacteria bacterium]
MGGQQLLLILLGVLVVGVAIAIGVNLFTDNSTSHNRDAIASEMLHLATRAQVYYRTPRTMNGGGQSFTGLDDIGLLIANPNGVNASYALTNEGSSVTLTGIGKELGRDGTNPVTVVIVVLKDSLYFDQSKEN